MVNVNRKPLNERVYDYICDSSKENPDGVAVSNIKDNFNENTDSSISGIVHGMLDEGRIIKVDRGYYLPAFDTKFAKRSNVMHMLMSDLSVINHKYQNLSVKDYKKLSNEDKKKFDDILDKLDEILS